MPGPSVVSSSPMAAHRIPIAGSVSLSRSRTCSTCMARRASVALEAFLSFPLPCSSSLHKTHPFLAKPFPLALSRFSRTRQGTSRRLTVRAELAGQYEESFADVEKQLFDYFTFKAVNTVLAQLLEMNPAQYTFLYNFVVNNKVRDSKLFIRALVLERQELAERIMVTRLHLYNIWAKKYDHASTRAAIKDQNLELLRERLMETVKFQAEDPEGQQGSTAP